ncbi:MAG: primase [Hydrocarboniphaga sp.]|uniref:DNA primase n=1 Tax=Hydrocarboniphaga sp. TaxID=2033016 RepID=UPI0026208754|nr:DNA primase [Hydrocarboniphaga sp.]MDB5968573.1 primase [Hydrocarboniphaga sp.]
MAGLIPQSFIHDLLARTDIVEVISSRLELKRAGREYKALSPFSNEKSASFFVSPTKQFFHCFSSGKHGNAVGFLMEYDRLTFVEAVEELAKRAGLEVPREGGGAFERLVLDGPLDALAAAERFFREQLRKQPIAIEYLKKRGLSGDTAKAFGIGFAPDSWDALTKFFDNPLHAIEAGLLIPKDDGKAYDRFRNRVMFPIRDTRGRVIGFGGRTLGNDPAKYLNSPETPLFHKGRNLFGLYEAKQSVKSELPHLLVVEGYMDVVMLAQHGIHTAVATLGTATTREQLALLYKSTRKIVFCFDGDRAGRSAAWRALEQALPEVHGDRECLFMFLPEGHDPDTLVQEIGADTFRERIGEAMTLSAFLLGELAKQANMATLDGRAKLAALARPHLEKLRPGPLQTLMIDELARMTRLRREDFAPSSSGNHNAPPDRQAHAERANSRSSASMVESGATRPVRRALQLLLERPDLADSVANTEQLLSADVPGIPALVEALEFFHENPGANGGQLLEYWRGTPKAAALERLMRQEMSLDDAGIEHEFADAIRHLQQKALRSRLDQLFAEARVRTLTRAEAAEAESLTRQLSGRRTV